MLKNALSLSRLFLFSPSRAAEASRRDESLAPCFWIFAAYTGAYLLFFTLKPFDFPDSNAVLPREPQTLMFWFKVMLWQPPLEAAWIVFLLGLLLWFKQGSLPVRLVSAVAWAAVPFILMVVYKVAGSDAARAMADAAKTTDPGVQAVATARIVAAAHQARLAKWALGLGALVWLGLFVPLWRRATREEVVPLVTFMLGLNAVGVVILIPLALSIAVRRVELYNGAQVAGGLWILACGTLGLRQLTGLRLPRVFMALLLSMFFQIALAFTLHLLGLVPKDILKALLYA